MDWWDALSDVEPDAIAARQILMVTHAQRIARSDGQDGRVVPLPALVLSGTPAMGSRVRQATIHFTQPPSLQAQPPVFIDAAQVPTILFWQGLEHLPMLLDACLRRERVVIWTRFTTGSTRAEFMARD